MRNKNKTYVNVNNCIDCGISIPGYRSKRCYECNSKWRIGENCPSYKDGRTLKQYYCKCGNKILANTAINGKGKCRACADEAMKLPSKKCRDCNKSLKNKKAVRCVPCNRKS